MRLRVSLLIAALLCGAAVVFPAFGWAAPGQASFALKPLKYDPKLSPTKSYFILSAKPGDVIHDQIRVVNTGGATGTAYLYPVDATTGQTSGAVYLSRRSPRTDVGAWIRLSQSSVTLAPKKNAVVDFTIRVPRVVRPGDHLGGIVAENAQVQQSSGKGALQIKIKHLTIDAVEVQLPGKPVGVVQAAGVTPGGEHGFQYVYVHLKSSGTVMLKPAATLTVRNTAGAVVAQRTFQLDTFLPDTEISYPVLLPKQALSPGNYTADVRVRSSTETVLGYRKAQPAPFDTTQSFPFTVTSGEQTQVYSGAAPVAPTAKSSSSHSSKSNKLLGVVVGVLAVLVVGVLCVLFLLLRRGRKARAARKPSVPAPAPATRAAAAVEPPVVPEDGGWAELLAAYDSEPRHRNGAEETPPAPPEPQPVTVATPRPEPADPPVDQLEPVVDYAPVGEYLPLPVHEEVPLPEYEPVFEPHAGPEFEPRPIRPSPPQPSTAPGPAELEELIVRHDLAVADAYFKVVQPDEPPTRAPAHSPAPLPPRAPASNTDLHDLSATLLDASLIALAAVIASRVLKNDH